MQKLVHGLRRIYQAMDAFEIFNRKTITSNKSYSSQFGPTAISP